MIKTYLINVLLGLDRALNAVLGGDPKETVSSRLGRVKRAHGGRYPRYRPWGYMLDKILDRIDPNHSMDAIDDRVGRDGIRDKGERWLRSDTRGKK